MRQLKISKSITNRDTESFERYLRDVGKVDLITPEEEVVLARKIRAGDSNALEILTKANLPPILVVIVSALGEIVLALLNL